MASSAQTNIHVLAGSIGPSRIAKPAALLAIALTVIALLLSAGKPRVLRGRLAYGF